MRFFAVPLTLLRPDEEGQVEQQPAGCCLKPDSSILLRHQPLDRTQPPPVLLGIGHLPTLPLHQLVKLFSFVLTQN